MSAPSSSARAFQSRSSFSARRERDCRQSSPSRDCGEPILWVTWPKSGKKMPINAEPKPPPYGEILVACMAKANQLIAEMAKGKPTAGRKLYESHFATCSGERATQMRRNRPPQGSARRVG